MTRQVVVPPVVAAALEQGAALAVSISGGKDSQALLNVLVAEYRRRGWMGPLFAVHAHLGRAEWPQTLAHCRNLCARLGVPFVEVRRPQGDLVQEIRDRMEKLRGTGTPPWPDARNRYCTSDQKRAPVEKVTRSPWPSATQRYCTADQKTGQLLKPHRGHRLVVAAMGMRAQESRARARRQVVTLGRITSSRLRGLPPEAALELRASDQRVALDWLPIHDWSVHDVWEACGHSVGDLKRRQELYRAGRTDEALNGWLAHPAYVFGNQRLSCALCILASRNDLANGARHNPELYAAYVEIERESGFTFRQDLALADLFITDPAGPTQLELFGEPPHHERRSTP